MKVLDYEEMRKAKEAVRILYNLEMIDMFIYEALLEKIEQNTGK